MCGWYGPVMATNDLTGLTGWANGTPEQAAVCAGGRRGQGLAGGMANGWRQRATTCGDVAAAAGGRRRRAGQARARHWTTTGTVGRLRRGAVAGGGCGNVVSAFGPRAARVKTSSVSGGWWQRAGKRSRASSRGRAAARWARAAA
ncbi:uncharacterized protein A4U43_C03F30 [Asparagus officinalis]|uniref:Uncharacterized protein n=1 Tax=Asparagus officinalis TaxID=4686 RepID=A0A5P1FB18_ASPOF|nr:uncharacterized protein A4U43_C03F30 [Asparagus officinalis]